MLCFLTARRLKPGSFDEFRQAWEPTEWDEHFVRAYHVRNTDDENEVVSFGFFQGTLADAEAAMRDERVRQAEDERQRRMAEFVESETLDGVFEVIEEVTLPGR